MLILALDTTTRGGSVALWRDGAIDERAGDPSRTHAERLPGDLASIVAAHDLSLADVDLYAVLVGPGSFTGMRVGIATIQGLALVHGRLVVGVSALDALAQAAAARTNAVQGAIVGAWMEAYRGEVFGALYQVQRDAVSTAKAIAPAAVAAPRDLADTWARMAAVIAPITVIGDAVPTTEALLRAAFGSDAVLLDAPLLAGTLASMAAADPDRAVRPHAIVPVYVRKPDAELARDRAPIRKSDSRDAGRGADLTSTR